MGKVAFLFAGQGAQKPGMGKSLAECSRAAAAVMAMADTIRPGTSAQCWTGTQEELNRTVNTQPCLFCADLMAAEALKERGVIPDAVAGFSLGEIPALTFAGALNAEDAFRFVVRRGETMDACAAANPGAMFAVIKLDTARIEEICAGLSECWPVNYNSAAQTVVACAKDQADALSSAVKAAGGRAMPVAVSGAFHSPYMNEASQTLAAEFADMAFCTESMPVYANRTAQCYEGLTQLFEQVNHPVQWQKTVENMAAAGIDTFIEVGPGKTLSGLVSRILPDANVYRVEDAETLESTLEALQNA